MTLVRHREKANVAVASPSEVGMPKHEVCSRHSFQLHDAGHPCRAAHDDVLAVAKYSATTAPQIRCTISSEPTASLTEVLSTCAVPVMIASTLAR